MKVLYHLGAVAALLGVGGLLLSTAQVMFGLCPPKVEWPAGWSDGAAVLPDGRRVAIIRGADRVQVYDAAWQFARGWNVGARGRLLGLTVEPEGVIVIQTPRAQHRYTAKGTQLSTTVVEPEAKRLPSSLKRWVPGSSWTWFLVHPVACFLILLAGFFARLTLKPLPQTAQ